MNTTFSFKHNVLPHLLAIVFFFVLTATYFSPILFEHKTLSQSDIMQFRGGAQEAMDYRAKTGKEALWTNSMFSGMPTYLISTRYPGDLFQFAHKALTLDLPPVAANVFLTLVCAYILFVALGMSSWLAIAGGIALAFSSYNLIILEAGHNTKSLAIAYMPLVLAGLILTFRNGARNFWMGGVLFAFGLTMQIRANHLQITYYLLLMILLFGIVQLVFAIKEKWLGNYFKRLLILGIGAALAVGVSFGRIYNTYEYGKYSIRGKSELKPAATPGAQQNEQTGLDREYAFGWSYGVGETITLLIPDFYGGASQHALSEKSDTYKAFIELGAPEDQAKQIVQALPTYWGDQPFTSGPVYLGAIICFLFVLGLFIVPKQLRYWLLAATVFSILLSWGKNFSGFNDLMFDFFPGYNKFRAVSMALVIAQVAVPLMGMLALQQVFFGKGIVDMPKKVLYAGGITAGLCLLAMVIGGMGDFSSPADQQLIQSQYPMQAISALRADRAGMMRSDTFRSIVFILLAAAVLYFYLKGKLSVVLASVTVGLLILIDLWSLDKRYLNSSKFQTQVAQTQFEPTPADLKIMQDKDLSYRVINLQNPFNDARTSYFHKSIGGYHGAKLRRYQDIIDQHISHNNMAVMNMLNTRYFITGQPEQPVQTNPGALGNAWFVGSVKTVQNPDEEIAALKNFNPANEAIVDVSKFPASVKTSSAVGSVIKLVSYSPDELVYIAKTAQTGLAVFSEIYYKDGWNAYIDGKLTPHIRVNYVLRALEIPAGTHKIEFRFEPKDYALGNTISMACSVFLLVCMAGAVAFVVRGRRQ